MRVTVQAALLFAAIVLCLFLLDARSTAETAPQSDSEPAPEPFILADWPPDPDAARGRKVYEQYCLGCHGQTGRGDGDAASLLNPIPRNFQKGFYKFRTTPSGKLPTAEDLFQTITNGLPGSSMPSFRLLSEPQRKDVVSYVLYLSSFGLARLEVEYLRDAEEVPMDVIRSEHLPKIREMIRNDHLAAAVPVAAPPSPPVTAESIARGRERYMRECSSCHGKTGVGDGPSAYTLRDWKDAEIRPRDFTTGVFRAGSSPRDLWIRLRTGLNGTPMPAISGSDEDLWALVHFMQTLIRSEDG